MLSQVCEILSDKKRQTDSLEIGNEDDFIFCPPDGTELSRSHVEIQLDIPTSA